MANLCLIVCLIAATLPCYSTYKPVIFMHGILAAANEADTFFKWILEVSILMLLLFFFLCLLQGKIFSFQFYRFQPTEFCWSFYDPVNAVIGHVETVLSPQSTECSKIKIFTTGD